MEYGSDSRLPEGGSASHVEFAYSSYATVGFSYDSSSGKYLKSAFGVPHMDADTNSQLAFDNVVVILADTSIQAENGVLADIDLSEGKGYYFFGGNFEEISWSKGEPEQPLILKDKSGDVLKVNTGKSYVGILSSAQKDTIVISEETQTTASVERVQ